MDSGAGHTQKTDGHTSANQDLLLLQPRHNATPEAKNIIAAAIFRESNRLLLLHHHCDDSQPVIFRRLIVTRPFSHRNLPNQEERAENERTFKARREEIRRVELNRRRCFLFEFLTVTRSIEMGKIRGVLLQSRSQHCLPYYHVSFQHWHGSMGY